MTARLDVPAGRSWQPGTEATRLSSEPIVVLIPVFNDWQAVNLLLKAVDERLAATGVRASVLLVDDGSEADPGDWSRSSYSALDTVRALHLRRNLGHQRAISLGLAFVEARLNCDAVVVMDGDGEDTPSDAVRLLERYESEGRTKVVFASRRRRSEGPLFRVFYVVYRNFFRLATGTTIRVGNFSVVPRVALERIVAVSEIWNHYAAGVQKARVPRTEVPTDRGHRLAGKSQMRFVSLIMHGLSAISVYADVVSIRLLLGSLLACLLLATTLVAALVLGARPSTMAAIPSWTVSLLGSLLLFTLEGLLLSGFFVLAQLGARRQDSFLPCRDHAHLVMGCSTLVGPAHTGNVGSPGERPPSG